MKPKFFGALALALASSVATAAHAQTPFEVFTREAARTPVTVLEARGNVRMLEGAGGNIAVLTGRDGVFMVDAGIAASEAKIRSALRTLGAGELRYVVTTHWHWDHAEGNGWLRRSGATVISSSGVAKRLGETIRVEDWGHTFDPVPVMDRPDMVLQGSRTMRFNGERILIRPYQGGHTDGDLSVYFANADVLVTGDTFWAGMYPFIDYVGGGSIDGAISAANRNIEMAGPNTRVIPGHGPVASRADLIAFRDMLVSVRNRVASLKSAGKSLEETIAARPTSEHDARWGAGIVTGEWLTALVYRGV
jgi:glyoxylase-like metal-dependent hydrolase (beta-lactamase superfamily II)